MLLLFYKGAKIIVDWVINMKKKKIDRLSYQELKKLRDIVNEFDDIDSLKEVIDSKIENKEKTKGISSNIRFNMEKFIEWQIFDPFELKVIKDNNINNMQELIDCDLDSLVGITPSVKIGLWRKRGYYDMRDPKDRGKSR